MGMSKASKSHGGGLPLDSSVWRESSHKFGPKSCCLKLVTQYVLLAVVGSFNFGYSLAALNTSKQWISYDFKWCPSENGKTSNVACDRHTYYSSFINVGVFFGAIVGCLMGGRLTEMGRRASTIVTHGIFILGSILSASSEGFVSLFISRIVVGVGVGFSTVCVPMLISEMTPKQRRGFYGVLHQMFITVGILAASLFGLLFGVAPGANTDFFTLTTFNSVWWRVMLGLPLVSSTVSLILLITIYKTETPHFLVETKQVEVAEDLLREIYEKPLVTEELDEICLSLTNARLLQSQSLSVWSALFNNVYRPVILIGCVLSVFQQFTGINVFMANSNSLYAACGLEDYKTHLTVGMSALNVLMTFPPIWFIDRLGRRTLMLIGTAGQALSLLPAMIANLVDHSSRTASYISVASTFLYVVFFAAAYGPILWVYLHEIFPAEIKQGASSLASSLNWLATIVMVLPSDFLLTNNPAVIFVVFTVMGVAAFAIVFVFMKETKGLSIDDSPYFKNKNRKVVPSVSELMVSKLPGEVDFQRKIRVPLDDVATGSGGL